MGLFSKTYQGQAKLNQNLYVFQKKIEELNNREKFHITHDKERNSGSIKSGKNVFAFDYYADDGTVVLDYNVSTGLPLGYAKKQAVNFIDLLKK